MKWLDVFLGRTRFATAADDNLLKLSSVADDIHFRLQSDYAAETALVIRRVDNAAYEHIEEDLQMCLSLGGRAMPTTVRSTNDGQGWHWIILTGTALDDTLNGMHLAADLLTQSGYGDGLLAALIAFSPRWFLVYNYARAAFYPFVPLPDYRRNEAREIRIAATLKPWLPVENDINRWYALWNPPFSFSQSAPPT
ncbi:MAG: hypothetical protein OWS74_02285 [Firmicutes bacterium]|nr:hypothetical protein [Bacillota bacterium]